MPSHYELVLYSREETEIQNMSPTQTDNFRHYCI